MKNKKTLFITQAALIAALYVVLTYVANAFGLASGNIQLRFSEALTVLPYFTPAAIPGLFVGCLLANLFTGSIVIDIIFGSIATLIAAVGTYYLRKHKFLCKLSPILVNAIVVPFILYYGYGVKVAIPIQMLTVGVGEALSVLLFGGYLMEVLQKYRHVIFKEQEQ